MEVIVEKEVRKYKKRELVGKVKSLGVDTRKLRKKQDLVLVLAFLNEDKVMCPECKVELPVRLEHSRYYGGKVLVWQCKKHDLVYRVAGDIGIEGIDSRVG